MAFNPVLCSGWTPLSPTKKDSTLKAMAKDKHIISETDVFCHKKGLQRDNQPGLFKTVSKKAWSLQSL